MENYEIEMQKRMFREEVYDSRVESTYRITRSLVDYGLSENWKDIMPGLMRYIGYKAYSEALLYEDDAEERKRLRRLETDAITHFIREYLERWCMYDELFPINGKA